MRIMKSLATVALAGLLVFGSAGAANALTTVYPNEGGTWKHGTEKFGGNTWIAKSEYYHSTKKHTATAGLRDGTTSQRQRITATKGTWAKAGYTLGPDQRGAAWYNVL